MVKQSEVCHFALNVVQSTTETCATLSEAGAGHEIWKLIFDLVRNLSEVILQTLPSFWKVAKGYMEGKYQKVRLYPPV